MSRKQTNKPEEMGVNADLHLNIDNDKDFNALVKLGEAISNPIRVKILKELQKEPFVFSVPQLVATLKIPTTTLLHHLDKLEKGKLIRIRYKGSTQGTTRIVSRGKRTAYIIFASTTYKEEHFKNFFQELEVGLYADFSGEETNIVVDKLEPYKNPFTDERVISHLIYTPNGTVTYNFNNQIATHNIVKQISFSLEICSEAPYYNNDYLSEITFWVNKKELCTYLSLGDYGDRRGNATPLWWPRKNTQYGKLVNIVVDETGVYLNENLVNNKITIHDLDLDKGNKIEFTLGNKPTSTYIGGFNLFGKGFGDYMQGIIMNIRYE